jgi:hypothetical protein
MNLLEHYIIKVHSVEYYDSEQNYVLVDLTCNCYGAIQRVSHLTTIQQWEIDKKRGFYLA